MFGASPRMAKPMHRWEQNQLRLEGRTRRKSSQQLAQTWNGRLQLMCSYWCAASDMGKRFSKRSSVGSPFTWWTRPISWMLRQSR